MIIGMYGQSLLANANAIQEISNISLEENRVIDSIIEESFDILNESAEINAIKKKIDELKNDPSKITKKDIDEIVNRINEQRNKSAVNGVIWYFAGVFFFMLSIIIGVSTPASITVSMAVVAYFAAGLASCIISIKSSIDSYGYSSYSKLIKYEAKISNKIKKLKVLNDQTKEVKDQIKQLEETYKAVEKVKAAFRKKLNKQGTTNESAIMLEFKGNEDRVEAFRIVSNEIAEICKGNYDKITMISTEVDKMINIIEKSSKSKDKKLAAKSIVEIRNLGNNLNKNIDNDLSNRGDNFDLSDQVMKKDLKSFSVKYSEISMEQKKAIANKLNLYLDSLKKMADKYDYNGPLEKHMNDIYNTSVINDLNLKDPYNIIISWFSYLCKEIELTVEDIKYVIKELDLDIENKFLYQKLNPIKKK